MRDPMLDNDFLKELNAYPEREIFASVIALNYDEEPIDEISGHVTSGNISIDGKSAIRRTCSLSMVAEQVNLNDYYWGLNTKVKISIGMKNFIDSRYPDIIWFPQGVFVLTSFSSSQSTSGFSISLQGKDKMCLLNGELGGTVSALSVDFGKLDEIDEEGNISTTNFELKNIIIEAVHEYAREPYSNIIVNDLDSVGLELYEYRGSDNAYLLIDADNQEVAQMIFDGGTLRNYYLKDEYNNYNSTSIIFDDLTDEQLDHRVDLNFDDGLEPLKIYSLINGKYIPYTVAKIERGDTVGYRITNLTYAGDLIASAGSSITSAVLDPIVKQLGNFEYFYDLNGRFVFQRKKTFANISWNSLTKDSEDDEYADNAAFTSSYQFSFENGNLITAFNNNPDLGNVKNDFAIWGEKKGVSGATIPIHMRYAIDKKPKYYKTYDGCIYITQEEYDRLTAIGDKGDLKEESTSTVKSAFHVTKIPKGLDDNWWEIDDWTRRYLYFSDVDNEHDMNYYLSLSGEEAYNIINAVSSPGHEGTKEYYIYNLKQSLLGNFGTTWKSEDWLTALPKPTDKNNSYYNSIVDAENKHLAFWVWLFDTALDNDGNEYIYSIEHGYTTTNSEEEYPTRTTGCSHRFYYALQRKQNGTIYHAYIYDPIIPDSLKSDDWEDKYENTEEIVVTLHTNYRIVDWREIIYRMALDYRKWSHEADFNTALAANNGPYYPKGITGYERYYTDMEAFWRGLYDPDLNHLEIYKYAKSTFKHGQYKKVNEQYLPITTQDDENEHMTYFVRGEDIAETHPAKFYYQYDPKTDTYHKFSEEAVTGLYPVDTKKTYYYYNGSFYAPYYHYNADTKYFKKIESSATIGLDPKMTYYENDKGEEKSFAAIDIYSIQSKWSSKYKDDYYIYDEDTKTYNKCESIDSFYHKYNYFIKETVPLINANNAVLYTSKDYENVSILKPGNTYYTREAELQEDGSYKYHYTESVKILDGVQYYYELSGKSYATSTFSRGKTYYTLNGTTKENSFTVPYLNLYKYLGYEKVSFTCPLGPNDQAYYKDDMGNYQFLPIGTMIMGKVNYCFVDSSKELQADKFTDGKYFIEDLTQIEHFKMINVLKKFARDLVYYVTNDNNEFIQFKHMYFLPEGSIVKDVNGVDVKLTQEYTGSPQFTGSTAWTTDLATPENLIFWIDFLDTEGDLSQYSIPNIGDRPKVENNKDVKAIYYREIPEIIFVKSDISDRELELQKKDKPAYTFIKLTSALENLFTISSQGISAQDELNNLLYDYSYCTESVSITTLPVYHLQPNTRIFILDKDIGINGEYIIDRLSIPLSYNGTMSISATKAVERIY